MGTNGRRVQGRICFWTTGIQIDLVSCVAEYYGTSRSRAVALIVRKWLASEMSLGSVLGVALKEAQTTMRNYSPLRAVRDLADEEVCRGIDDIPW